MDVAQVKQLVQSTITDSKVFIKGQDCDFALEVVSQQFHGLTNVKRQQMVLGVFTEQLRSGELHALTVKAFTPTEWEVKKANETEIPVL